MMSTGLYYLIKCLNRIKVKRIYILYNFYTNYNTESLTYCIINYKITDYIPIF